MRGQSANSRPYVSQTSARPALVFFMNASRQQCGNPHGGNTPAVISIYPQTRLITGCNGNQSSCKDVARAQGEKQAALFVINCHLTHMRCE